MIEPGPFVAPDAPPLPAPRDRRGGRGSFRRRLLVPVALLVGVTLRLLQYAADRSLWLDEALLAASIPSRNLRALLLEPLEHGQTAPAGFLLLQKLATSLLGTGEYALRLVPFVAGLGALLLAPALARAFVSRRAAPLAVALVALAPFAVYYAAEAKPYALDLLAAVVLLLGAERVLRRPTGRAIALLATAGAAALTVSQPAVFVAGGVGIVLAVNALRSRDRTRIVPLAGVGIAWAVVFAGVYALSLRSLGDPEYMRAFWRSGFPDGPLWWARAPLRLFREPLGVFGEDPTPLSAVMQGASVLLFGVGCWWMATRGRSRRLALLLAPGALALLAAALRLYPFGGDVTTGGRLLLFLLPTLVLVVAEGAAALPRVLRGGPGSIAFAAAVLALLASPLLYAAVQVPHLRAEVEPLIAYAAEERQPGDLLYVHYSGRAPFRYYAGRHGWTPANSLVGRCSRPDPGGYLDELELLRPPRIWVLFNDDRATSNHDDRGLILAYVEHRGRRVDDRVTIGAAVYLYDLRLAPAAPGGFRPRIPRFAADDPALACRGPWANAP